MNSVEEDQRRRREEEEEEEDESISLSVSVSEDSEEVPQLSAATLGALLEFYGEEEERQDRLRDVQEGEIPDTFTENWNLSQFWYSDTTSQRLASECLRVAGDKGAIACLSCPTLYRTLRAQEHQCQVSLLEYDTRFACFGSDFYFYDYRSPLALDNTLRGAFDLVVADPPHLSTDCLTKTSLTVRYLGKPEAKIILLTGEVMEDLADRLLGARRRSWAPEIDHSNNLANPFVFYANYSSEGCISDGDGGDSDGDDNREVEKKEKEEEEEERDRDNCNKDEERRDSVET
ncbi:EEF1A lysine methyltransferase 1-like [Scylla paramamosain]|uniref:EEF1A lysine methyltransferase 1-like n=1 Tax=Scylla paramamosain TaxID=85552 RepID=UPI0030836F17